MAKMVRTAKNKRRSEFGPEGPADRHREDGGTAEAALSSVEQSLQSLGGDAFKVSMDGEARTRNLMGIQRALGNRYIQRMMLQRDAPDTTPEDLKKFRKGGPYPSDPIGMPITPSTGMGGFNARYDPVSMDLTVTLNLAMSFLNGMNISGNTVTANEASMDRHAKQINKTLAALHGEKKTKALDKVRADWQWTGPADPAITSWMAAYRSSVTGAWSSAGTGLMFKSTRLGWDEQLARVKVVVNTSNATGLAPGAAAPGPAPVHCKAKIYKTPDQDMFGANVEPGFAIDPYDQVLNLGSGQLTAQSHLLTQSVFFPNNSSKLTPKAKEHLRKWIISFQAAPGTTGQPIGITGHANAVGEKTEAGRARNVQLADERAQNVSAFLSSAEVEGSKLRNAEKRIDAVMSTGAASADEERNWRRVDIVVGTGQGQNIAAHEFGHMIGLGDEYASTPKRDKTGNIVKDKENNPVTRGLISGTGGDVGGATAHDALSKSVGLGGSVFENNDNIMSLGSTVQPQHYATFLSALHTVTGITEWMIKPK